ncbi:hypothetical protein D9757_003815 [Collybiopsis confluens]|uniref:Uncharacterized protein n=1 Tax=Collybiopsis confluens TaxID=2823264 RepID=A0A8H5MD34_9AGAR|nr:hypothetical protein D9757_003815 [Collybiopsis confluens]
MRVRFSLKAPWTKKSSDSNSNSNVGSSINVNDRNERGYGLGSRLYSSPERFRNESGYLDRVPEDDALNSEQELGEIEDEDGDEDEEEELEAQLAAEGLYRGSFRRLLALYTFVPLSFLVAFIFLAFLPTWIYSLPKNQPEISSVLPFPLPELAVSAGLWSLSYLLHTFIYSFSVFLSATICGLSHYSFSTILSTILQVFLCLVLRLVSLPILLIPHHLLVIHTPTWADPDFRRVWWIALGWAAAEAAVAIKQGYQNVALYRDVLVEEKDEEQFFGLGLDGATSLGRIYGVTTHAATRSSRDESLSPAIDPRPGPESAANNAPPAPPPLSLPLPFPVESNERMPLLHRNSENTSNISINEDIEASLELRVDEDLEQLMAVRARDELEKYYGVSFIQIPVFVSCLQRANDLLFSLGITLTLAFAYVQLTAGASTTTSPLSFSGWSNSHTLPWSTTATGESTGTISISILTLRLSGPRTAKIVLPLVFFIQLIMSLLHSRLVLPKAGVHTVVYIGTLISLGLFFAGLSVWGALS